MGNSHDRGFLPQLETWRAGEDPILAEAAQWAIGQINAAGQNSTADQGRADVPVSCFPLAK
jgi:hypothetical protein